MQECSLDVQSCREQKGLSRRALLGGAASVLIAGRARADVDPGWRPRSLDVREIFVEGTQSRRFVLGVPTHLPPGARVPLLVLLHGLGETVDERMGAWAWFERYGLGTSYDRLLAAGSMAGLVLACPFMPNLPIADPRAFDAYTRWMVDVVAPRARQEASSAVDAGAATYLAGCSLGGHFSLEFLLRRPEAFTAWGGVQTAIGETAGQRYGQKLAALPTRELLVETSTADPFRAGNEALSKALARASVRHTFVELPGPHDQRWLRASGTERMLGWFSALPTP
jgi:enterochelin esterase-like enzyme